MEEKNAHRDKVKKGIAVAAIMGATAILIYIYRIVDPAGGTWGRFFPKCPVRLLTGLNCPSCGIQRAIHALLSGDVAGAFRINMFIPISLIYLLGMLLTRWWCSPESEWRRFFWGMRGGLTYIGLYVGWFIVRNILGV